MDKDLISEKSSKQSINISPVDRVIKKFGRKVLLEIPKRWQEFDEELIDCE